MMTAKIPQELAEFMVEEHSSGDMSLILYFKEQLSSVSWAGEWLEKLGDLPQIVQSQLQEIDYLLTSCRQRGLCHTQSMIVLKGPNFFNREVGTYDDFYIHCSTDEVDTPRIRVSGQPPVFDSVNIIEAGSAVIVIQQVRNTDYKQQLSALLQEMGLNERRPAAQANVVLN